MALVGFNASRLLTFSIHASPRKHGLLTHTFRFSPSPQRRAAFIATGGVAVAATSLFGGDRLKRLEFDAVSSVGPILRLLDAETAHNIGIWAARRGLFPKETRPDPPSLTISVWGREFPNPIGVAAGFDKNAEAVEGLLHLGFGFVEIGSVTPLPQPGNPKPRCFRLQEHRAIINRYGFNSDGVDRVRTRLAQMRRRQRDRDINFPRGIVGVNLGKNKTSPDAAADYCTGVAKLGPFADYLVINISSPNTPGLRALQSRSELEALVRAVQRARDALENADGEVSDGYAERVVSRPPLLVKIAPDLTEQDKADIAAVALRYGIDGLIVSNTTITRPGEIPDHPDGNETGGLSGVPLFEMSTNTLRDMYKLTKGKIPIVGVGGVASGKDAYEKIRAGASLVELYTAFAYDGPALIPRMKAELAECLQRDGFKTVAEAVGTENTMASTGAR